MTRLSPPDAQASARLIRLVAGVTLRRLRKVRRRLLAPPFRDRLPRGSSLLRAAEDLVRTLDRAGRLRLLHGPDLRGFLSEIEIWSDIFLKAGAARRPAPRGCRRRAEVLFDRISRTEHLVDLVPIGRLDPGFPDRAARLAAIRLRHAFDELPAILLGARLAFLGGRGTFEGRLATRESPEQGRPAGRADLGTFCGEAGPLALLAGRSVAGRGGLASGRADGADSLPAGRTGRRSGPG